MYTVTYFPTIDMKRTGKRIEQLRKARGLSIRQVQEYFGFEYPQAIYKWQWGETLPSVDNLFALAKLLRVEMQDLLVENDREVPLFVSMFGKTNSRLHDPEPGIYDARLSHSSRAVMLLARTLSSSVRASLAARPVASVTGP